MRPTAVDVSVVVPVRDRADLVRSTVAAALRSDGVAAEVVVLDLGSLDRSGNEAEALAAERPGAPITLVHVRRTTSRHDALQAAIQAARAPRVVLLGDVAGRLLPRGIAELAHRTPHGSAGSGIVVLHGDRPDLAHHVPWSPDEPAVPVPPVVLADRDVLLSVDLEPIDPRPALHAASVAVEHVAQLVAEYGRRPSTRTTPW